MDVNEYVILSNIILRHKYSKGTSCNNKGNGCKWTWETTEHYSKTQNKVKEQFVVRKDMDVIEHERLSKITLIGKLK